MDEQSPENEILPRYRIYYYERLFALGHSFTTREWIEKLKATNGICPLCEKNVGIRKLTIDHNPPIKSVPKGFIYSIDNVRPLCHSCNVKLGGGHPKKAIRGGMGIMVRVDKKFYDYLFDYKRKFERENRTRITLVQVTKEIFKTMENLDTYKKITKIENSK